MECISTSFWELDPFIIMPDSIFMQKHFNNNLAPNVKIATSENGYTDDELAYKWLWHFHHQTKSRVKGRYRLLIFDGHGSHMTYEFIQAAESLDIICFCLIAHSTHLCQPLDVTCFQQEKHWHSRAIEDEVREGRNNFTKMTFLQCYEQIRALAFTKKNIRSAFAKTGIYPFNPDMVLKALEKQTAKKLGDESTGGRIYNYSKTDPSLGIRVPSSNEPQLRVKPRGLTMWEQQPESYDAPEPLSELDEDDEDDLELPLLPRALEIENEIGNTADDLVEPFSEARLTDYGEENSGIRGLDDRWYTRTPFFQTPYGAKGIYEHATFLEKYEDEMSSPSRRLSNHKFRKGAQIEANLGAIARENLAKKDEESMWAKPSPFIDEENLQKHVKPLGGGRVISSGDGLRQIKARKEQEEEDALTKARKELERAERRHQAELDRVEKERKREEDIARKEQEKLEKAIRREQERAERDERKRIEEEAKEARRQELLA
jgi:hypothetical protein